MPPVPSYLHPFAGTFEQLVKFAAVGLLNTAVHGAIFAFLTKVLKANYSAGNLLAFLVAVTVSFAVNSLWTFQVAPSLYRYALFVSFMGAVAFATGYVGDRLGARAFIVFVSFSFLSFLLGFIYSKLIVF